MYLKIIKTMMTSAVIPTPDTAPITPPTIPPILLPPPPPPCVGLTAKTLCKAS